MLVWLESALSSLRSAGTSGASCAACADDTPSDRLGNRVLTMGLGWASVRKDTLRAP
jgi:hypothetical protein